MRKRIFMLTIIFTLTTFLGLFTTAYATEQEMRGIWVSTVYNLDYPKNGTTNEAILKAEADAILDNAKAFGLNAIFLQVRPSADSLYPSEYFPWSRYLTGSVGTAPANNFDPLEYFVEGAHARGLELHAWVNPYRITKDGADEYNSLPSTHPARTNPEYTVIHEGNYYFNPAIPQVRRLITDSVLEIVNNYDVDGIHMDDYFYPGTDFDDADEYQKYGSTFSNIGDFRRDNVNQLISMLDEELHEADPDISFGISPFGIWANSKNNSLGSNTNGGESYYQHYADTRKWVLEGTIDYIAPQLYWNIGHDLADYEELSRWWSDVVKDTDVKLYIGQAIYRSDTSDVNSVWYGTDEIERQMQMNFTSSHVDGAIFFRYEHLLSIANMGDTIKATYSAIDSVVPDNSSDDTDIDDTTLEENKLSPLVWVIVPVIAVGSFALLKSTLNLSRK